LVKIRAPAQVREGREVEEVEEPPVSGGGTASGPAARRNVRRLWI